MSEIDNDSANHRKRVKEKYAKLPIRSLPDYELLELLLFFAIPRKDVKPLAKALLKKYQSLVAIANADLHELKAFPHFGENAAVFFKALSDYFSRLTLPVEQNIDVLNNWSSVINYCQMTMGFKKKECFRVLFLNRKNVLLGDVTIDAGTVDKIQIYPREIAKAALEHSASAIILVHNHPSGECDPSPEDIEATKNLINALEPINVKLHDHLIVGGMRNFSFRAAGLLK